MKRSPVHHTADTKRMATNAYSDTDSRDKNHQLSMRGAGAPGESPLKTYY